MLALKAGQSGPPLVVVVVVVCIGIGTCWREQSMIIPMSHIHPIHFFS
jgi:hypothetical protein